MSTENLKSNQFHDVVRNSEINDYIEKSLDNFSTKNYNEGYWRLYNNEGYWRLYNKDNPNENTDQVKTVYGICFTFTALLILGTYSTLF